MKGQSRHQEVRECTFQLKVVNGTGSIRFPCSFYVVWQTANGKNASAPSQKVKKNGQLIPFDDILTLTTHLLYDTLADSYQRKDANVLVNLISSSRPNDPKLVGRVTIDLAELTSSNRYSKVQEYPL